MNTVYERRRANLAHLLREAGAKQQLAIRLDMTAPQISHWLRDPGKAGSRKIAEDSARQIEGVLGLTPGALDREASTAAPAPAPAFANSTPGGLDPSAPLLTEVTRTVLVEVGRLKGPQMAEKVADIVALAYGHASERGAVDHAYIATLVKLMH